MKTYVDYAKKIAETLCSFGNHPVYGGRQAGSRAENAAADFLAGEMKRLGLQDVRKEGFPCDFWEFRGASLRVETPEGALPEIQPYAYASGGTEGEGITAELLYLRRGTEEDYRGVDARGCIVLIDIDMDADWWIDAPVMEAALHGAAAVVSSCSGGYAGHDEDTLNCQDFCGPLSIPSVNISRRDADKLKSLCRQGRVRVTLQVDNEVRPGGRSYNISGKIPGKHPDELIIVGDHYDSHFRGFQDNASAVGMTLSLARWALETAYRPERTLIFILHGAEEWGCMDTRYDWAVGAWNQVNRLHPQWQGKAVAYFNFELPAYQGDSSWYLASSAEFHSWSDRQLDTVDPPKDCYPGGIRRPWWSITPWSDEWSYSLAGIPSFINGFMLKADGSFADFIHTIYHSQYDTADTWNGEVFAFNFSVFTRLIPALDQSPAVPLDFSFRGKHLESTLDEDLLSAAGADLPALRQALQRFTQAGRKAWERAERINEGGLPASEARRLNETLLKAYRLFQDHLVRFTWSEEPIYPHQGLQKNIRLAEEALTRLGEGSPAEAAEALSGIDLNYLAPAFSREVFFRTMNQTLDPAARDRQFWGKGRVVSAVDFFEELRLLKTGRSLDRAAVMIEVKRDGIKEDLRLSLQSEAETLEALALLLEGLEPKG